VSPRVGFGLVVPGSLRRLTSVVVAVGLSWSLLPLRSVVYPSCLGLFPTRFVAAVGGPSDGRLSRWLVVAHMVRRLWGAAVLVGLYQTQCMAALL